MLIGVPREIMNHEYRVGLTPSSVRELVAAGLRNRLNVAAGKVTCSEVANDLGYDYVAAQAVLAA